MYNLQKGKKKVSWVCTCSSLLKKKKPSKQNEICSVSENSLVNVVATLNAFMCVITRLPAITARAPAPTNIHKELHWRQVWLIILMSCTCSPSLTFTSASQTAHRVCQSHFLQKCPLKRWWNGFLLQYSTFIAQYMIDVALTSGDKGNILKKDVNILHNSPPRCLDCVT